MKRSTFLLSLAALLAAPGARTADGDPPADVTAAQAAFDRLKGLEGVWTGASGRGNAATLTYEVIAGGHAVMEEFTETSGENEISMHTIYHLDGDTLMLTHYCVSNNQPRMRADLTGWPERITFELFDVTNLSSPADGHMYRAVLELQDTDRLTKAWTYRQDGADRFTERIEWKRSR